MPSFRFRVRVVLSADGDVGVEFGYVPAAVAGMPGIFRSSTAGARFWNWHVLRWSCPFLPDVRLAFTRDGYVAATTDSQREATPLVGWKSKGIVPEVVQPTGWPGTLGIPVVSGPQRPDHRSCTGKGPERACRPSTWLRWGNSGVRAALSELNGCPRSVTGKAMNGRRGGRAAAAVVSTALPHRLHGCSGAWFVGQ